MNKLTSKHCKPCEGAMPCLLKKEVARLMSQLQLPWQIVEEKKIQHTFVFDDFVQAISFVNTIAVIAEKERHHPDIFDHFNIVTIELWTHAIGGLSVNDFILASKIEMAATNGGLV